MTLKTKVHGMDHVMSSFDRQANVQNPQRFHDEMAAGIGEEVVAAYERCRSRPHGHPDDHLEALKCVLDPRAGVRQRIREVLDWAYKAGVADAITQEHERQRRVWALALLVVVLTVSAISVAALALQVEPQSLIVYLAQIVGVAGTAVGYRIGSATRNRK
jgi:hypothetical protein